MPIPPNQPYVYIDPTQVEGITNQPFQFGLNLLQDIFNVGADAKLKELYEEYPHLRYAPAEAVLQELSGFDKFMNSEEEISSQHKKKLRAAKSAMDLQERARLRREAPDYFDYIDGVDTMNMDEIYAAKPAAKKALRKRTEERQDAPNDIATMGMILNQMNQGADRSAQAESERRAAELAIQLEKLNSSGQTARDKIAAAALTQQALNQQEANRLYADQMNQSRERMYQLERADFEKDLKRQRMDELVEAGVGFLDRWLGN